MPNIVLLTNPIEASAMTALGAMAEVVVASDTSAGTLVRAARDVDVIVVRAVLPERLFESAARLRGVVRQGTGIDMVPMAAANAHGVAVANVPGVNARSVAEFALGLMIALARRTTAMERRLRENEWFDARSLAYGGSELHEKSVAIVGMGAIGGALAHICAAGMGMRVIGVGRSGSRASTADDFERRSIDDALPDADFVVLACPLTEETRGMIDAARLQRMKPSALLINIARGAVVDEGALIDALERRCIGGAAIDVYAAQPLPADSRLRDLPQVILTPHVAGVSVESMVRMGQGAVRQVRQILDGEWPTHWVNRDAESAIRARWARLAKPS